MSTVFNIIKNLFRIILLIGCGLGLVIISGISSGNFQPIQFIFYTIQSNIVIFVLYLGIIINSIYKSFKHKRIKSSDLSSNIMGGATLMIVVTGLVFNFILAPSLADSSSYSLGSLSNLLVHTFTPLMVFIDWVLFVKEKDLKKIKPLTWTIIPLVYWIFTIIRAQVAGPIAGFNSYYPYFFIDANTLGWTKVFAYVFFLLIFFILFGYLMKLIKFVEVKLAAKK